MTDQFETEDFTTKLVMLIFFAVLYFIFRAKIQQAGDYSITKPIVEIFVVIFLIFTSQTVVWISRYYMPKVAVNNFSGSILGRPVVIKDRYDQSWALFNTGEYLEPFHGKGKLATLVIPLEHLRQAGKNFLGLTFVRIIPAKKLPPVVYSYLMHHSVDYNLQRVYFGKFTEEFQQDNPEAIDYELQIQSLQQQINLRDDLLEGRNDELVEMKKFAEEMSGSKQKWYEIFKRKESADKE